MAEDNTHLIQGLKPLVPIPNISIGKLIHDQLLSNCNDNPALIDAMTGQVTTYKTLFSKSCSLAESLRKSGFGQNTIISICSENSIEFFTPVVSALFIGAVIAPINNNYTETEMLHALKIAEPSVVFASKIICEKFANLKKKLNFLKKIIVIDCDDTFCGFDSINSFIKKNLSSNIFRCFIEDVNVDEQVAFILYSSGTTGLPKGVVITHRNFLVKYSHANDPRLSFFKDAQSILGLLPFYHAYGLFISLSCITKFLKIIVMKKFDENVFLKSIEEYKITSLTLVPPLAVFIAKSPLVEKYNLSSVKEVSCGAAPLSKSIEEALKKRLSVDFIGQGYGMTETTLAVMGVPTGVRKPGSCGRLYPYLQCKIRDPETGKSLGPNQIGEICVKGPIIMKGYYRNKEATKNAFKDGWLLTGDLGYYDQEEFFYITGRLKELIKYKGFQVAPAELESILLQHPEIKDVAVIGVPDEEAGELPFAFVVRNSDDLTEEEVQSFLDGKVSSYKKLRGGVLFVEEIPKNPSGKILRRKLQDVFNKFIRSKL